MALPLPDLDTRRYADLLAEVLAGVPALAPAWTDFNPSDPGITLLELLAYVAEQDIYRVNRVPPGYLERFLALAGAAPHNPAAATLVLQPQEPTPLAAGTRLRSDADLDAVTLSALAAGVPRLVAVAVDNGTGGPVDRTPVLRGTGTLQPFGPAPAPGAALLLTLDAPPPAGEPVPVFVAAGSSRPVPGPHHSARTVWEVRVGEQAWRTLDPDAGEVTDATRSLTQDGLVVLHPPADVAAAAPAELRCRLVAGAYDATPEISALAVGAVLARQEAPLAGGDPLPPDVPTTPGDGAVLLGSASGAPHDTYRLPPGVLVDRLGVWTRASGGWTRWTVAPDLDAAGPADLTVAFDPRTGLLRFGDGGLGALPPAGAPVVVTGAATAGAAGNVTAGTALRAPGGVVLRTVVPGAGGADAETLADAATRVADALRAPERLIPLASAGSLDQADPVAVRAVPAPPRAVTAPDVERLALDTPGTLVARARAWPGVDLGHSGLSAPGTVSLVVVPELPAGRPAPSEGLLDAVRRHLHPRRPAGTRLLVGGPDYVDVVVSVAVAALRRADATRVQAAVTAALDRYLDPLAGGPAGRGWPFGRAVRRVELLAVVAAVPGVDHVSSLELASGGSPAGCGDVLLAPHALVAPGQHGVTVVAA